MKGFVKSNERLIEDNNNFRQVFYTGQNIQLVLMSLQPGEGIGSEVHDDHDQFFRFEFGTGEVLIADATNKVKVGDNVIVPAGAKHNVVNSGLEALRLYTIYGPPKHLEGTIHKTKTDADTFHRHFDGGQQNNRHAFDPQRDRSLVCPVTVRSYLRSEFR